MDERLHLGRFRISGGVSIMPTRGSLLLAGAVVLAALASAYIVVAGYGPLLAIAFVAFGALTLAVVRPEILLIIWFTMILTDGRWLVFHKLGPLYVTEVLLAVIAVGTIVRLLLGGFPSKGSRPVRFSVLLLGGMWVPAIFSLALLTHSYDLASARNFALILYSSFAAFTVVAANPAASYRAWFAGVMVATTIALLLTVSGHTGGIVEATSTGAIRYASGTFLLAFGIAPLILAAAAREGLVRPLWAVLGSVPCLIGLVFVNHRSGWLAFVLAVAVLFVRRITVPVALVGLTLMSIGIVLVLRPTSSQGSSTLSEEILRAKSISNPNDPNIRFRLRFWKRAMEKSAGSPFIGTGFNPYPESIVPPESGPTNPWPAPHNSFVGIAYRIGLLPMMFLVILLLRLIGRGFSQGHSRPRPRDRAICLALTAVVVYVAVASAFNVYLEAPYVGPLFWTAVGLLIIVVYGSPFGPVERPAAEGAAESAAGA